MEQNNEWVDQRLAKLNPEDEWRPHVTTALARLERRREQQQRRIGPRTMAAAAVAVLAVSAFPQPRAAAQRVIAPCLEACQSLAMSGGDFHDHFYRMIWSFHSWMGLTAPDFAATDASGTKFQLSDYAGKVVLLNFWASWCVPCQKEMPWFTEFERTYAGRGFEVIGISLDEDGWKAVRPVLERQKINYRVAMGTDEIAKRYGGLESLPETLLIGQDGRIFTKHVGVTSKDQFEREIGRAMWKELTPEEKDKFKAQWTLQQGPLEK